MDSNNKYLYINKKDIKKFFNIKGNKLSLKSSKAKPIKIKIPFKIDEDIAKISGMMPDGSLNKNFKSVMFSQKKDKNKVKEFSDILKKLFGVSIKIRECNSTPMCICSSKTLAIFFNKYLDITKSDEKGRIPYWIWVSPKSVVVEYLRYAFAMEGSVSHYLKEAEVKFHSVDLYYLNDLKKLLKNKFNINFKVQKYYIKDYGWKYYLYINSKKEITKFNQISFALKSHQKRLEELISNFKNKAWEIILISVLKLNQKEFSFSEIKKKFPLLSKWAIYWRLRDLEKRKYIQKEKLGYSLTNKGYKMALSLKDEVKITKLRTDSKKNEENIINFLNSRDKSYRNEIARELRLSTVTTRDVLRRLIKMNKIKYLETDKFQRRFYKTI